MRRRQPEKAEQANIVHLLRSLGAAVYVLGTRRPKGDYQGSRQTPGLPDLLVFLRPTGEVTGEVWIEVKAAGGCLSPAQFIFSNYCDRARVAYIVGGLDEVIHWLIAAHYLRRDQVAHFHHSGGLS